LSSRLLLPARCFELSCRHHQANSYDSMCAQQQQLSLASEGLVKLAGDML
jgi:hypothetical protein